MNTLKNKMILSYSLISLLIIIILGVLFNMAIDKVFEKYAINQKERQIENVISQINEQFIEGAGLYNVDGLEIIGNAAMQNGIFIHIQTVNKEIDWDIQRHKAQECLLALQHAEMNMHSRYPNFQGGYTESTYDLKQENRTTGYLTVGYYGPYSLDDDEILLINQLNRALVVLGALFVAVAVMLGYVMAKRITGPITSVIDTAQKIAAGSYGTQTNVSASTEEIAKLISSVNEMSHDLERNEQQKKRFSADVAHELRTPLNNLQSHMEAMIDEIWEPSSERLQSCHAEILRLTQIVAQLQELHVEAE